MNLNENIYRLKELMGILREQDEDTQPEEEKDCYPSDYEPGKTYERDDLAKIFSCFAGEDKFPVSGVKEWMFPLLPPNKDNPVHHSPSYDPKNMDMGYEKPLTMEEFVEIWKLKCSGLTLENISITPEDIHQETLDFIPTKKEAYGGKRRIAFQMKRAMEDGVDSLTKDEPFVVELKEGKYKWDEGWNRLIALIELYNQGKIPKIVGKSWVATRID